MSTKSQPSDPLIFAWGVRDHSTWHLVVALILLMGGMAGFFFIFRIVHPAVQRMPTTPQHVILLDPKDPSALALMHRAQDRSFALLNDSEDVQPAAAPLLAFRPSFEGYQIKLREPAPVAAELRQPRLFTAASDVLPPVLRRATEPVTAPPAAVLRAIMSPSLAKRGAATVELSGIHLTQPTRVQFRVAVGSAGQVVTALPLGSAEEADIMKQLYDAVAAMRFSPAEGRRIEWGDISFRWGAAATP